MCLTPSELKVLVIDDTPINNQMVCDILAGSICQVSTCTDPHEGLRQIMVNHPDVVLLDLDIPELSGLAILHQIRGMEHTRDQKVIMFTAHSDPETVGAILELKVSDYLVKPFKAIDLIRKLNHLFERDIFK